MLQQSTEFHRRLEKLAGTWDGKETHYPFPGFPEIAHASARVRARFELNGLFLIRDYETYRGTELLYQGHGLYGWDARRERYTIYWFDTAGTDPVAPGLGVWQEDRLIFEYERGRQPMRLVYQFPGDDRYTFMVEAAARDGWQPVLGGDYRRTGREISGQAGADRSCPPPPPHRRNLYPSAPCWLVPTGT